uniref:telomere-associated protein RIF1 n=1 Tax=Monopterus albus TaxID=43700 RepID=UPI0009B34517|nr:telomere-associated protein RIF1 [Monopterus albus]
MMAVAGPPSSSGFLPLLESVEDSAAGQSEQTDAYLTIANRLSGEEGRQFLPAVEKHFSRLGKAIMAHITSPNAELSQAALQALGFCVYHPCVASGVPGTFAAEILLALCSLVVKSVDKNTCTRALWVISKQSFPPDMVADKVPSILGTLESVWSREDLQSAVMEHEALNVVIRLLEQVPTQMGEGAVRWAKLVIPLVVHSASKVRLRAAVAMEMGMPLLLTKQTQVAAIIEPMMSSKLIPELQKLFVSKNETNVLKLWPLFVRLLGKLLHRGGPFINSLLHLEELGFRSSSPTVKKIAFIAWKSLIDNFALNPDILCSSKRMKLLMQPLTSINVRTEALLLTKVEVWWYLVVQLGPNLSPNFDQISAPLLHCTIGSDSSSFLGTPSRAVTQSVAASPGTPSTGISTFSSSASTTRVSLNSSAQVPSTFPSIQLLGLEMLLHYFLGPEVDDAAAKNKLVLSLEPLKHPLLSGASSFIKHAAVLISNVRDGFTNVGKGAPESLLAVTWTSLAQFVSLTIESVGSKKDRQGSEVLTLMLQALQSIVTSEALPADRVLVLFEATLKVIPQRVLGSASYQVGKMDVLNGTPALFLLLLLYDSSMLPAYIEDERFFQCLHTLVACGLSGPASPLTFAEAVLGAIRHSAGSVENKEQLWRMWNAVVIPLTDTITQSNEVNQGDALEHNFSAMHSALLFPITHLLRGTPLQQATQKSMLSTWSKLYKVFARCSALVATAEENVCCEELCTKMTASVDKNTLMSSSLRDTWITCCSPVSLPAPHTPGNWMKKRSKALGNLSTFQALLVQCLEVYLEAPEASEATGMALVSVLSALFTNLILANAVQEALASLIQPLTLFYQQAASEPPKFTSPVLSKTHFQQKLKSPHTPGNWMKKRSKALGNLSTFQALLVQCLEVYLEAPEASEATGMALVSVLSALFTNLILANAVQEALASLIQPLTLFYQQAASEPPKFTSPVLSKLEKLLGEVLCCLQSRSTLAYDDELLALLSPLLCVLFPHKNKQLRTSVAQFWNSTFANSVGLTYPDEIRPILSQVKQKTPIILPSFEVVTVPDELSEPSSSDSSQLETKLSGMPLSFLGKRDSLLGKAAELNDKSSSKTSKPVSTKLDFGSPKPPRRKVLEEESSVDFVFIPPETKERVLTEHQKEIKRTKRVDIPAMYNNLDASLDTTIFTQFTQSQEDSLEKLPTKQADKLTEEAPGKVQQEDVEHKEHPEVQAKDTKDCVSPKLVEKVVDDQQEEVSLESDVSMEDDTKSDDGAKDTDVQSKEGRSLRHSRRQNFITLEKYSGGKPASPSSAASFTGPHMKASSSQESSTTIKTPPSQTSQTSIGSNCQDSQSIQTRQISSQHPVNIESPRRPKDSVTKSEPVRLTERLPSDSTEDEGVIPDTPVELQDNGSTRMASTSEETMHSSQREETEQNLGDSQSCETLTSLGKLRRSASSRIQAQLPEQPSDSTEDECIIPDTPVEMQGKNRTQSTLEENQEEEFEETLSDSPPSVAQISPDGPTLSESYRVGSLVPGLLGETTGDTQCDVQQNLSTTVASTLEETKHSSQEEESEPAVEGSQSSVTQTSPGEPRRSGRHRVRPLLPGEDPVEWEEKCGQFKKRRSGEEPKGDSPKSSSTQSRPNTRSKQAEEESSREGVRTRAQSDKSESSQRNSQGRAHKKTKWYSSSEEFLGQPEHKRRGTRVHESSQTELQSDSQSDFESQSPGRRRRQSKPDKMDSKDPLGIQSQSNSQTTEPPIDQAEPRIEGRTRMSKVKEELSNHSSIPESSQILDTAGFTESSQGRSRYSRRRSSQVATMESSESESPEARENSPMPRKRGRKPRVSLQSPLALGSKENVNNEDVAKDDPECSPQAGTRNIEAKSITEFEDSQKSCDVQASESLQVTGNAEQSKEQLSVEAEIDAVAALGHEAPEKTETKNTNVSCVSPRKHKQSHSSSSHNTSSHDTRDVEMLESGTSNKRAQDQLPCNPSVVSAVDTLVPPDEITEALQVSESASETETRTANTENDVILTGVCNVSESASKDVSQDSPAKQKGLEAVMVPDVGQSPISGKIKGTWSPSVSPSSSILKKGQKRQQEDETPSPLVKSRRVSFANPIQQQETADDIDRRSPAVRTISPRKSKVSSNSHPKCVSTPTKRSLILSPRNLHSPSFKSSKKCLISEMSQEPRLVSRDCIYPALVGCSTPVEAVLPKISSNMSRGFGQLVRARNIKTVGDLSALTPNEIKTLPIRSPKISNVKKALKVYEQQCKGRGGDELKSFDETEMMTSELEETSAPQNQDEEKEKTSGETLATELVVDECVPVDEKPEQDCSRNEIPDLAATGQQQQPEGQLQPDRLLSQVEALTCRMTPLELSGCSPQQLVLMHDQLGGMMRRLVVELQSRLCQTDGGL